MKKIDYTKFTPLGVNLLVQRDEAETVTAGGIHLPEDSVTRPPEATVVRCGLGPKNRPEWEGFEVDDGDAVLLERFGGTDLGDGWAVVPETCVLGLLENDGNEITPLGLNIIVRMLPPEEREGRIVLPEFSKETQEFGVVMGVASRCRFIEKDDWVYVSRTQGAHYRVGGQDYIIVHEEKIHAKVEKPESEESDES